MTSAPRRPQLLHTVAPEPSSPGPSDGSPRCRWCLEALAPGRRADAQFCPGEACRQAAYRVRKRWKVEVSNGRPRRFGYADPPFPGLAKRRYGGEPDYAGEVDLAELIPRLDREYDGWALSTSAAAVLRVGPLCPDAVRPCAWVKPIAPSPRSFGLHNTWEVLLVKPGRRLRPATRDFLIAQPARGGLPGTCPFPKPEEFCVWLFRVLGMQPGDALDDLYPGSGIVSACWREISRQPSSGSASDGRRVAHG